MTLNFGPRKTDGCADAQFMRSCLRSACVSKKVVSCDLRTCWPRAGDFGWLSLQHRIHHTPQGPCARFCGSCFRHAAREQVIKAREGAAAINLVRGRILNFAEPDPQDTRLPMQQPAASRSGWLDSAAALPTTRVGVLDDSLFSQNLVEPTVERGGVLPTHSNSRFAPGDAC